MKREIIFFALLYFLIYIYPLALGFSRRNQVQDLPEKEIPGILKALAIYCHRLENAALDFVCLEKITEKVDSSKDIAFSEGWRTIKDPWTEKKVRQTEMKNKYLYDFQYVRKNFQFKETRTLLEENGIRRNEKDATLKTTSFYFKNLLMGPVGILSERYQSEYDYNILGEGNLDGIPVVILDITLKPGYKSETLFGKAWLNRSNFDILKIEWSQNKVMNFQIFEERADRYKSEPLITLISEFAVEKNGIRFPSQFFIEEAYIDKKGKKFIRSETTVVYKDFRFFTVEVEVKTR